MTIELSNRLMDFLARRTIFVGLVAFMVVFATGNLALGQIVTEGVRQDNIEVLDSSRPIMEYIIAGVCIFGSLAIGFKSSNRAQGT